MSIALFGLKELMVQEKVMQLQLLSIFFVIR